MVYKYVSNTGGICRTFHNPHGSHNGVRIRFDSHLYSIRALAGHVTVVGDVSAVATATARCVCPLTGATLFVCLEVFPVDETPLTRTTDDDVTRQLPAFCWPRLPSER